MSAVKLDEVGYWSEVKLEIIQKYASAYARIMEQQRSIRRFAYIDGFAGAGVHISRSTGEPIPGSPKIALNTSPAFSEYHFIDLNEQRVGALEKIAEGKPNVSVHHGDCNQVLQESILPRCRYEDYARGLCLLDPYALSVDWSVLEAAGQMKSVEVFYNFMIMDANMNVLWRDPSEVNPKQAARMDRVWGDGSWRDAAYRKTEDLLGDMLEEKTDNESVAEAFRVRLKEVAGFKYVPKPLPMRNSAGSVIYYLYFASPNETGGKIVRQIFDKYRGYGA